MYYYVNKSCKLVFIYIPTKLVSMQNAIEVRKDNFHHSRTFLVWMWQQSSDRYASCLLVCFVFFLVLFLSCYCFVLFFVLSFVFCFALFVFGQHWSEISSFKKSQCYGFSNSKFDISFIFIINILNTIPYIHICILTQQHISCDLRVTKTIVLELLPVIGL
jgi:hypothetical protein